MSEAALRSYVKAIETPYRAGSATEHTYRPYLKSLLETLECNRANCTRQSWV